MSDKAMPFLLVLALALTAQATARPDLSFLVGKWSGTLTYLDYKDNKSRVELKATLVCTLVADGLRYQFNYVEPNGKPVQGDETAMTIGADGRTIKIGEDEWTVNAAPAAGRLVVERKGTDAGQPARFVRTYSVDGDELRIETVVTPASGVSLVRNLYALKRDR